MNGNGNGFRKALDVIRSASVLLTPLLLVFVAYMQLAEDKRARERWEEEAFGRRVLQIIDTRLDGRELATKGDIDALRDDVSRLEGKVEPIYVALIKKGIIE